MDVRLRVGLCVQRLRHEKGLTQEELAHSAKLHQTYLSAVEHGKRNPSILVLERLAGALGVEVGELFKADVPKPARSFKTEK